MADGDLSAELAEAKKAFHTANAKWAADPYNFGLEKVKLSAEVVVKEIEFKIKEAELKALLNKSMGEENALVEAANKALIKADEAFIFARGQLQALTQPSGTTYPLRRHNSRHS